MVGWWVGNALGVVLVIPLVVALANRVIRPAREAARYADDVLAHGVGITEQLAPVPALVETGQLAVEIHQMAGEYVAALRNRLAP